MKHPLIDLALKDCYLNSHHELPLVSVKGLTEEDRLFWKNADMLVRNITDYPHAYVLACLMDSGVDADIAWCIPYRVYMELGSFEIMDLQKVEQQDYINMFSGEKKWHRYPVNKAMYFYDAVQKIVQTRFLDGDASRIWANKPSSYNVIFRFLDFKGCGFKIANMSANLLYRHFGIEFSDYSSIDIAPDAHTMRVFQRLGLTPQIENLDIAKIYTITKARELYPDFPGIVDNICWVVGREYCHPRNPKCDSCPFEHFCEKKVQVKIDIWE
jgi:endonuclease III